MNDLERWRGCAVTFEELDHGTFTLADCVGALADVEVDVRRGRPPITPTWGPGMLGDVEEVDQSQLILAQCTDASR